jgi:hypothetical protein
MDYSHYYRIRLRKLTTRRWPGHDARYWRPRLKRILQPANAEGSRFLMSTPLPPSDWKLHCLTARQRHGTALVTVTQLIAGSATPLCHFTGVGCSRTYSELACRHTSLPSWLACFPFFLISISRKLRARKVLFVTQAQFTIHVTLLR